MSQPNRLPKLGDIVLYHEGLHEGIRGPSHIVTWPAIVTEIIAEHASETGSRLRITAFCPFDKPKWDISAHFAHEAKPGHWSWPDSADNQQ